MLLAIRVDACVSVQVLLETWSFRFVHVTSCLLQKQKRQDFPSHSLPRSRTQQIQMQRTCVFESCSRKERELQNQYHHWQCSCVFEFALSPEGMKKIQGLETCRWLSCSSTREIQKQWSSLLDRRSRLRYSLLQCHF